MFRPDLTSPLNRIQPVDAYNADDEQGRREKRKAQFEGREWSLEDDDFAIQPQAPERAKKNEWDSTLFEEAKHSLLQLTTLEERAAQLLLLQVDAFYDAASQKKCERWILQFQLGGVLFHQGFYERQAYLISRFQEVAKTPLLIANDLLHAISFCPPFDLSSFDEKAWVELGEKVMKNNQSIGVQLQLDHERGSSSPQINADQKHAFCRGIRRNKGILGRVSGKSKPFGLCVGYHSLSCYAATAGISETELLQAYRGHHDLFIIDSECGSLIDWIAGWIRSGKICEKEFNQRLLKLLMLKSFSSRKSMQKKNVILNTN